MTTANHADGESRKQAAHVLLEAHRERLIREARRVLLQHLLNHGTATIDDVRDSVELANDIDPKVFGVVPGSLARAGIIRRVGFATTTRVIAHARPVTVWRLVDAAKAQAWLASHRSLAEVTRASQLPLTLDQNESPTAVTAGVSVLTTPPLPFCEGIENHG